MSPYNLQPIPRDQIDLRQEIELKLQPEVRHQRLKFKKGYMQ